MRPALLAANWKLNPPDMKSALALGQGVEAAARSHAGAVDVNLFPPFVWLSRLQSALDPQAVTLGAQDCYWEPTGAFTGEVSAAMLKDLCRRVIVGHSERRRLFGDSDETVALKVRAVLDAGLEPVVCVGEDLTHLEAGRAEPVVAAQVEAAIQTCEADEGGRLVLAYEPVWAIGTGRSADLEHAHRMMTWVRTTVAGRLGSGAAREVRVLYGGSVNARSAPEFVSLPSCDGCLVGGASLDAEGFSAMIASVAAIVPGRSKP